MPSLQFATNIKIPDPKAFALEFSRLAAETLNKPEKYITVNISQEETLTFAGTFEPAFTLNIFSLDNLNEADNESYSKTFFEYFKKKLGIPGSRGYITFQDPGRAFMGHEGTTFATIFGK